MDVSMSGYLDFTKQTGKSLPLVINTFKLATPSFFSPRQDLAKKMNAALNGNKFGDTAKVH